MRTETVTIFTYGELSDKAKDRARDWYRESGFDYDWWDSTYEDCRMIFDILGIDAMTTERLHNGKTRDRLAIYFSGFSCQGDGAQFNGTYRYKAGSCKAIRSHAPQDNELHRIADGLADIQRWNFYQIRATIKGGRDNQFQVG